MSRSMIVAVAAALLLAGATPAFAQATPNSARIEGRITDETGAALPGVAVSISSVALQAPQVETVTDNDGRYRLTGLPGGIYTVKFALAGFQTMTREGLNVDAGFAATLDARLKVGQIEESVTVQGASPMVDIRSTTVAANIKKELMETIPTSRSYADVGKLAPGVRVSGAPDVGGNQTGGQRGNLVSYGSNNGGQTLMLDGVNTDGTAGYFDFGAIEEMVVRPAGNDPEIPTSGMAFQVIIKAGGNQFHGDGLVAGQTRGLQGHNVDAALQAAGVKSGNRMDHYYDLNGSLGGRIITDRLWFFGSSRRKEYQEDVLSTSGQTTNRESNLVAKLSGQLDSKNRLSWMEHYGMKATDSRNLSVFVPVTSSGNYTLPHLVYKGDWNSTPTDRSVLLVSIGRSWYKSGCDALSNDVSTYDNVTLKYGGAVVNCLGTGSDVPPAGSWSQRWQYDANYTYYKPHFLVGAHEFKVGVEFTREWYDRHQDLRTGPGGVDSNYQLIFSNGAPFEVLLFNSPFLSLNNVNAQGAFVRDAWSVTDRLTFDVGVRVERYHTFLPAQSKLAGPYSSAADYPETSLYDWRGVAPRLGVSYAPAEDKRTVVKATYGHYNFALRPSDTTIIRNLNPNEYAATLYRWNDVNGNKQFDPGELGAFVQTLGGATVQATPGSTVTAVRAVYNPNVQQPKADEITLTLEHQLAGSLMARLGYVYLRESSLYQLVNTARPASAYTIPITTVDPGPDGKVGTADDGGAITYYDYAPAFKGPAFEQSTALNTAGYTNSYNNIEAGIDKRLSKHWQALASFLGTHRNVWISGIAQTPNDTFFPKDETWERTFRVAGSYQAPLGILGSMMYEYQSGMATARTALFRTGLTQLASLTLRMEPVGSERLPATNLVSLRAEKRFQLQNQRRLTLQVDLYNALNANSATAMSFASGPTYGTISAILPPRVARFGATYSF
jgi:outer membrane receptor protein involved in Fe transport